MSNRDTNIERPIPTFPFTAIVGQDNAKLALLIAAVNPGVGGVLLSGDKGTGKSTLVRALADLLPEIEVVDGCPFNCNPRNPLEMCDTCYTRYLNGDIKVVRRKMKVVNLPLSITIDRLVGTLDVRRALREGIRALQPGLLAEANRNILYIDEVNLLEDYIADTLLDAAAMGWNIIEREGISVKHPARFILVGSMNPEEGELRPQILDRFGLYVKVEAPKDPAVRKEVVRRVEDFYRDPISFIERYRPQQEELRKKIIMAREIVQEVEVPDDLLNLLIDTVIKLGIRTHRAEIVTVKAAKAIAALDGRKRVNLEDLKKAMELALPHRIRQKPFEQLPPPPPPIEKPQEHKDDRDKSGEENKPRSRDGTINFQRSIGNSQMHGGSGGEKVFNPSPTNIDIPQMISRGSSSIHSRGSRRTRVTLINMPMGLPISSLPLYYIPPHRRTVLDVDLAATIASAALRGSKYIDDEDIMVRVRRWRSRRLFVILLDSSGSMAIFKRIAIAKGIAQEFARNAYVRRDDIALICFRGRSAQLVIPPTRRYEDVFSNIERIPTGGSTPLPSALHLLYQLAKVYKTKYRNALVEAALITDGKANVGIGSSVRDDIERLCSLIKRLGIRLEIYDTRPATFLDPAPSYIDLIAKIADAPVYRV